MCGVRCKLFKSGDERGVVSLLVLAIFIMMTISFYTTYRVVLFDYDIVSKSSELKTTRIQQTNVAEIVQSFYKEDMLNDVSYEELTTSGKVSDETLNLFKVELQNYGYRYVDRGDMGLRKLGRFDWVKFKNYQTEINEDDEYRLYDVKSNWDVSDDSGVYDSTRGSLLLPKRVNVRVNFEPGNSRITLVFGSSFEEKTFELINRPNMVNVFELKDLPRSVDYIKMSSDSPMGSTSFEILQGREVDIEIFGNDVLGYDKSVDLGTVKTVRVELGEYELKSSFVDVRGE